MLTVLIGTLVVVNLGGVLLLYLQHRQAAREREAIGRIIAEMYTAADGAIRKSAAIVETATAAHAQFERDRGALLEALRATNGLRVLVREIHDDLRGGAR